MKLIEAATRRMHARLFTAAQADRERGDVPGWVLITIMTAGLVTALWQFAGTELVSLFRDAVRGVSG